MHPAHRAALACMRSCVPLHLVGEPGTAKTATLAAWAQGLGMHAEFVVGATRDKGDFMGMPVEREGEVTYSPPSWVRRLQTAGRGLLVLDEFTSSSETFALSMRAVQERVVGEAPLPDTTSIVAISNPVEIAVDGMELPAPVANRFIHLDWHFDHEVWAAGLVNGFATLPAPPVSRVLAGRGQVRANAARLAGLVAEFTRVQVTARGTQAPRDHVKASAGWPSPRSWTGFVTAASHLHYADEDAMLLLLVGAVGEGAANDFWTWRAAHDLADPVAVMDDPRIVDFHGERVDRLFAMLRSVTALGLEGGPQRHAQALAVMVACARAGKPDAAHPGARALMASLPVGASVGAEVGEVFADLFAALGSAARAA